MLAISGPGAEARTRRDELLDAMQPWSTGKTCPNFSWVDDTFVDAVRRGYQPDDYVRTQDIKARHDPDNLFRINFNIPLQALGERR